MPAPETTVTFYRDLEFVGAIGAGSNFFFVACDKGNGLRQATSNELSAFSNLIGLYQ